MNQVSSVCFKWYITRVFSVGRQHKANCRPIGLIRSAVYCLQPIRYYKCLSNNSSSLPSALIASLNNNYRMLSVALEDRLSSDRFYTARHIDLPRDIQLNGGFSATVNYAKQSEVTSIFYPLLQAAVERGDNIGVDEFDGPYRDHLTEFSTIFAIRFIYII
jgi:hypothetical protein